MPLFPMLDIPSREEMDAALADVRTGLAAAVEPLARRDELPVVPPPPDLTQILADLDLLKTQMAEAVRKLSSQGGRIQKLENASAVR